MSLPRLSVRNPVAVNLLMWLIVIGGVWAWQVLIREFFPTIAPEAITITVPVPGAPPDEIEELVTRRIELEVNDLDGVDEVTSRVLEGLSVTTLKLDHGIDAESLLNDVRTRVDRAETDLPSSAEDAIVNEVRPVLPVASIVVFGSAGELKLREAARKVRDDLRASNTISRIGMSGVRDRELHIEVQPSQLERHGLTFGEVGQIVAASNLDVAGGQLKGPLGNVRVRTLGEDEDPVHLEGLAIRAGPGGASVLLRDLGTVKSTFEDRTERGRYGVRPRDLAPGETIEGERAVIVTVFKTADQDALEISAQVKDYIKQHPTMLGGSVKLALTNDLARFISQRLDLMIRNARAGIIFVLIALAVFLNLRVAFWVGVGIPISFLGTFLVMKVIGSSLNLMTMFGLIIVLGILVDDAIVIGENVFSKMQQGVPPVRAAIEGTMEVGIPVLAAVSTTMLAFLPLMFIEGRIGTFLGVLPVVVIVALGVSLIEAFIIMPTHLAHMKPGGVFDRVPGLGPLANRLGELRAAVFERAIPDALGALLRVVLRWRYVFMALAISFSMGVAGLVAGGIVPFVFLEEADAEQLAVDLEMAAGTTETRTLEVIRQLERIAFAHPEVKNVFSVIGTSFSEEGRVDAADPATVGQLTIDLVAADVRERQGGLTSKEVMTAMRREAQSISGTSKLVFQPRSGGPTGADIEARVRADNDRVLEAASAHIQEKLGGFKGVAEIRDDLEPGKLEVRMKLLDSARSLGLTTRDLALQLRGAVFGAIAQELQIDDDRVKVRVRLPEQARLTAGDLGRLRVQTPTGGRVPLGEVTDLTIERGYTQVHRVDGQRAVSVKCDVDETLANTSEITAKLVAELGDFEERFPGAVLSFEGDRKETAESMGSLAVGFPIALLMIFAIIAVLFRSYTQPLIVMTAIPFSLVGAVLGHLVMGSPFTVLSMIGGVALAGIVVNDSLILVDFINRACREGKPVLEAAIEGSKARVRAILLTSVTTIAGLGPLLFERSFQAKFLIPMAVSIVFGLAFATILILLLIPTIYLLLEDAKAAVRWLFGSSPDPS